jgi:hypothetical protein
MMEEEGHSGKRNSVDVGSEAGMCMECLGNDR